MLGRLNGWLKQRLEPYCFWHSRDENEDRLGYRYAWINRCFWIHLRGNRHRTINAQWLILPRIGDDLGVQWGVGLDFDGPGGEHDVSLYLGLVLFTLHLSCSGFLPHLCPDYEGRSIEIKWHSRGLWWRFWSPSMSWSSKTPKWRDGHFDPTDFLLGGTRCTTEQVGEPVEVLVPMPEASYRGVVKIERRVWTRPRWPWPVVERTGATIDMIEGVPFPGKGENSWDCGEDAIFGTGSDEPTPEAAVAAVVKAALNNRRRYGGSLDWRPERAAK
jgi:hypothetical protein